MTSHTESLEKPGRQTAEHILTARQAGLIGFLVAVFAMGLCLDAHDTLIAAIGAAMIFWVLFVGLRIALWIAAGTFRYPAVSPAEVTDRTLPRYSILVPLHNEAKMLPSLVEAITRLLYPNRKLQVLLLLEADDDETWAALRRLRLPASFKAIEVPPGGPRTKPNALNVGLALATGELCVIYDAEDRPEPDQLLKAVSSFRTAPPEVACLQARLAFWNGTSSWVTRFYWAEYVTHFEWMLAGAARLRLVPPLGGTSNHFRTETLREMAIDAHLLPLQDGYVGGWDPYNVTEDAELAGAFARHGYRIAMLDSTTWEEATARLHQADKQRRRWLKGYTQTGFVYTRTPRQAIRQMGFKSWFFFNLIMLGTPISLLLSPLFWGITAAYFLTRSTAIEHLFPAPIFYVGTLLMVLGNVALFEQLVAACLKRRAYGTVKYMLCAPFWWLFASWSAYAMLSELVLRPHYWHKTEHGHDLTAEELHLELKAPFAAPSAEAPR
jgi:glycosyltransferase XagB